MKSAEISKKYCAKWRDVPTLTLARKMYKENSESFKDLESARSSIRRQRGQHGNEKRKYAKEFKKELTYNTNPFNLPESFANSFETYIISQSKTLILSDLHFPYQDNQAIELALNYGLKEKVTCILINGDLLDFATISRHETDWKSRSVYEEFEATRIFLQTLRKVFPKTKIVFKLGNHDERWEKWLYAKAPEIFDDPEFRLENRLRLGELGIDIVKDKRPIHIGKLTVLHGHELAGGSGGVNPARSAFIKTYSSCLIGHFHKTSSTTETTLKGEIISVHSQGCLCGMNPLFMPINRWNLGFSCVDLDIKSGEYTIQNLRIVNGKIY